MGAFSDCLAGTKALAALKALWFRVAASVWASFATSIRSICSSEPTLSLIPIRITCPQIQYGWCKAKGYKASMTADHTNS